MKSYISWGVASLVFFAPTGAHAQIASPPPPDEGEDIVVSGVRQSLENAARAKRDAPQVLDAISAEDIGKFPDKNIGEALQRVTGVQLTRTGGEGSGVTIRGADPSLNRVEINGVTQLSTSAGGSDVDFRDLPVEFVNRLEVVKSVTPDMTEGGLGGTVRIITRRPFDAQGGNYLAGSAQGTWSEIGNSFDPKFALIGSKTFANGTLGILLSATYERRHIETHEALTTGWRQIDGDPATPGVQPLDLDGNGRGDFFPEIPRYSIGRTDARRHALNGVVEWRPDDSLRVYVQGNYAGSTRQGESQYLQMTTVGATLDRANTIIGPDDTVSHVEFVDDPAAAINNRLAAGYRTTLGNSKRKTYNIAAGGEYKSDHWKIVTQLAYSYAHIDDGYVNATADAIGLSRIAVDYRNGQQAPLITLPIDPLTTQGINRVAVQNRPRINGQDEWSGKLDVEYKDLSPLLTAIKVGAQLRRAVSDSQEFNRSFTYDAVTNPAQLSTVQDFATNMTSSGSDFFKTGDLGYEGGIRDWLNAGPAFADAIGIPDPFDAPNLLSTWEVKERNLAGYTQASFALDLGVPVTGTAGFRVVNTRTVSNGYLTGGGTVSPVSFDGENTEFLPSVNALAHLSGDRLLLRLSATEVIARPTPSQLAPRFSINAVGLVGSRGNPELEPFRARQYDAGLEFYLNRTSFLSATYFRKEIGSFIENIVAPEDVNGVTYAITRPINGSSKVTIDGLELGATIDFSFLSVPVLNKFGVVANFTYSKDSGYSGKDYFTQSALPFPGLSRNSYNASVYYEDDLLSVRGSYNWRSDYLITALGRGNNPEFGEAFGQLDVSASINLSPRVSVFLEGINVTDATQAQNANSMQRRTTIGTYGRRVYGGVRFRL
ncbi:TonB-dependent receptor [Sphingomonas sp. ac-8]|uniref:TonB-dependent receptor n=1 Tax=Sphingomonas sp. ac-8 TaxID=3242977 RepID=UPI003A811C4B